MKKRGLMVLSALLSANALAVQVGDKAPDMALLSTSGKQVRLSDFTGSWVVLYFFPKTFSPGCTTEACTLRDGYGDIHELGAVILGVSLDTTESQKEFRAKYALPFDLLSDQSKNLSRAFDSLLLDVMVKRRTFLIDPEGTIAAVLDSVITHAHAAQVRDALVKLQKEKAQPVQTNQVVQPGTRDK
jgi:thioredoxin-dependent peroxiredoxin